MVGHLIVHGLDAEVMSAAGAAAAYLFAVDADAGLDVEADHVGLRVVQGVVGGGVVHPPELAAAHLREQQRTAGAAGQVRRRRCEHRLQGWAAVVIDKLGVVYLCSRSILTVRQLDWVEQRHPVVVVEHRRVEGPQRRPAATTDESLVIDYRGGVSPRSRHGAGPFTCGRTSERVSRRAVEYAVLQLRRPDRRTPLADRIGPVYTLAELCGWLTPPGAPPLTAEAVRKRAVKQQLVAFRTDDNYWAFPTWQFAAVSGRLIVNHDVIALWTQLPHDGWRSAGTLAAWMNTRLSSMDADAPAAFARLHGVTDPTVQAAVSRLRVGTAS